MTCKQYTPDSKSLELNRKRALFIGDSIMQGVATNYTITQNTWPKILSERYAMSHVNNGLGGSCYVAGYNGNIASIEERLYQCDLSEFDLLFMGGVLMIGCLMCQLRSLNVVYYELLNI